MKLRLFLCVASASVMFMSVPASADTKKDFSTISKALSFISGGPSGDVVMEIIYDAGNPDSVAHADEVAAIVAGGIGKKVKLTGKKVSTPGDSRVIFLTRGSSAQYAAALDKAAANGGITVSTDMNCLGAGCVLVVKTVPSVDILVSTSAAGKTGTEFASAFRMMITEK